MKVINEKGGTEARAVVTLVVDEKTEEPILFLERIYPNTVDKDIRDSLINFVIRKANSLKLNVLAAEVGTGAKYPNQLVAEGNNKTPWE